MDMRYPHEIITEDRIPSKDVSLYQKLTPEEAELLKDKNPDDRSDWLRQKRLQDILEKPLVERTTIDRLILSQAGIQNAP